MPELPEVEALAHHLRENALYRPVARVDVAGMSVLKTFDPPVSALHGPGRHRSVPATGSSSPSSSPTGPTTPAPDHPPVAGRMAALARDGCRRAAEARTWPARSSGCTSTRSVARGSTSPRPARRSACRSTWWPIRRRSRASPGWAPTRSSLSRDELAELLTGRTERIKTLITDQRTIAGIGNAYSDEILHTAKLSPYAVAGRLKPEQVDDLHAACAPCSTDAVDRLGRPGRRDAEG